MGLTEALLLDPYRMDTWVAYRTDGITGSGTQSDPFDGSTQTKFDALMNGFGTYTCVHLGPGTFQTNGYNDVNPSAGWQPKAGMKIVGSGIDVTTLQVIGSATNTNCYAIGHQLSTGGGPNFMDFFEVSDLTVDCHLSGFSGTTACGAVRVMGNHAKVRRVKAINWGTKGLPCLVIAVITADLGSGARWVEDCGIEDCIALQPDGSTVGPVRIFHAGGASEQGTASDPTVYGVAPYIRNCFADAGPTPPFTIEIGALSMSWSKAGVIEGNQIHNMRYGVFQEQKSAEDILIRNNWFKNVYKGIFVGAEYVTGGSGTLTLVAPTATVGVSNTFQAGDFAFIASAGTPYDGLVVKMVSATTSNFAFNTSITTPTSASISAIDKISGITNLIIEGNVVELATATAGELIGIHAKDWWGTANPHQDATYPAYVFGTVIIRDNKIRYLDGLNDPSYVGYGMQINGAGDLLVRNNVVDSASTIAHTIQNTRCGAVVYFNNLTASGTLIQGWNDDNSTSYEELTTLADFALVMSLFNRKS